MSFAATLRKFSTYRIRLRGRLYEFSGEDAIQLQVVGHVPAVPAEKLSVNNVTVWNFGHTARVIGIAPISKSFLEVRFQGGAGRRLRIGRRVGLSTLAENIDANWTQLRSVLTEKVA